MDGMRGLSRGRPGWRGPAAVFLVLSASACGSGGLISSTPTDKSLLDSSEARTEPIIRVSAAGVAPQVAHLDAPVVVTFINGDAVAHKFEAAPELRYGDCPEMAQLGNLDPGQSGTVSFQRTVVICAFHDAATPTKVPFQGVIVVH